MADNSEKISEIEEIQDEGAVQVTVDGVTVIRSFDELRKRKRELSARDNTERLRRPRISTVDLGKTF